MRKKNFTVFHPIFAGLLFTTVAYSQDTHKKPNIILINIDDLGWADVGYNGSTYYETPNIDRLHAKGISFSNGYACAANSAPSRASLLSGLNTPRHGVYTVDPAERGKAANRRWIPYPNRSVLDASFLTMPQMLRQAGYQTCHIGKWHVGTDPLQQGMDVNIAGNHAGHPASYFSPYKNPNLTDGPIGEYLTERLAREAVRYVDTVSRSRPFFLYYATYAVHTPLQAKPEGVEKYKQKGGNDAQNNPVYAAMVEEVDRGVGKLLDAIERNGLAENTLIVFTSDNGGVYNISKQHPLRAGKGSFYEGGIRDPFIVYMKGKYEGGQTWDTPVSQLDLFPTFAALANVSLPFQPDGENLLPLLDRGERKYLDKRVLYWNFPGYLEGGNKETRDPIFRSRPVSVIRSGDWKLIENHEDNTLELYNLKSDGSEQHNVVDVYPRQTKQLLKKLARWKKQTGAPMPTQLNPKYKE